MFRNVKWDAWADLIGIGVLILLTLVTISVASGKDKPKPLDLKDRSHVLELYNDLRVSAARVENAKHLIVREQQKYASTLAEIDRLIKKFRSEYKADGFTLDDYAAWVPNPKRE